MDVGAGSGAQCSDSGLNEQELEVALKHGVPLTKGGERSKEEKDEAGPFPSVNPWTDTCHVHRVLG